MDINNIPDSLLSVKLDQTVKFDQYWDGVEWAAKQHFDGAELDHHASLMFEPDEKICKALSVLHDSFYPGRTTGTLEEVIGKLKSCDKSDIVFLLDDYLPWDFHKALRQMHSEGYLSKSKYTGILKEILRKSWLLSWHWRAVLPSLRNWSEESSDSLVIQISHVRKWELLLCYTVKKGIIKSEKLPEIKLKDKILQRAPLFGISHRLKRWDTYRLFYRDNIKEYVRKKFDELKQNSLAEEAYILGRHDCYYVVEKIVPLDNKLGYEWTLKPYLEIEPEKCKVDSEMFGDYTYYKPVDLVDIPTFGDHEGVPQLLSSDNYCEAIFELTEVFNDPTAKSVLLIAPPGSGKEKLAESSYYCRDRDRTEGAGKFVATTLAGLQASEAAKLLFSHKNPTMVQGRYTPDSTKNCGLFFQAYAGALFIDEIDKTDRSIRDMLLRVLESGEVTIPESSQVIKIDKSDIPLYIFAGSMDRKTMFEQPPADFWTRVSHVIEVMHPLSIDDVDKSKKVVKDYLWMFWCLHVKDFMKRKGVKGSLQREAENKLKKPLNDFYIYLYIFLMDKEVVNFATDILSDEISGRGKPLVSIRTLRSVVARAIFKFIDVLLYSKFDNDPIEKFKENQRKKLEGKSPSSWFNLLKEIIKNENRRRHQTPPTIIPIELSVIDSFKTAIRLGTALAQ